MIYFYKNPKGESSLSAFGAERLEKFQTRVAEFIVITMLCIQPMVVGNDAYFNHTWFKYIFFGFCVFFATLATLAIWIIKLKHDSPLFVARDFTLADYSLLVSALLIIVSTVFSPYGRYFNLWIGIQSRFDGALTQLLYVVIFFIVSRWYKPRLRDFIIYSISAIVISLIAIFQFLEINILYLYPEELTDFESNLVRMFRTTIGNVNTVSTYACVATLLIGFLYIANYHRKANCVFLAGSALSFWLLIISISYSGQVGVALAVVLSIPYIIQNRTVVGRFLILCACWLLVYLLHLLLDGVFISKTGLGLRVILLAISFFILLPTGILLSRLKSKMRADSANDDNNNHTLSSESIATSPVLSTAMMDTNIEYTVNSTSFGLSRKETNADSDSLSTNNSEEASDKLSTIDVTKKLSSTESAIADPDNDNKPYMDSINNSAIDNGLPNEKLINLTLLSTNPIKLKLGIALIIACVVLGLLGIELIGRPDKTESTGMVFELREILHGRIRDEYATYRIFIWRYALIAFQKHPIIGAGPDTFFFVFPFEAHINHVEFIDTAHNEYLQILVCRGALGLLFYLTFIILILKDAVRKAFRNPMCCALLIGVLGYLVQAFFNISSPIITQALWVLAGILASNSFQASRMKVDSFDGSNS